MQFDEHQTIVMCTYIYIMYVINKTNAITQKKTAVQLNFTRNKISHCSCSIAQFIYFQGNSFAVCKYTTFFSFFYEYLQVSNFFFQFSLYYGSYTHLATLLMIAGLSLAHFPSHGLHLIILAFHRPSCILATCLAYANFNW